MRVRTVTFLAFVLLGTLSSPSEPQTLSQAVAATLAVPDQVRDLRLAETHRYPNPRLGVLYRYRNNSALRPDVYIYPPGGAAGSDSRNPAREEGMNFGRVLTVQRDRRQIGSFEIRKSAAREFVADADTIQGWHVHAVVHAEDAVNDTHLFVFGVGDQMLKVRSTWPEGSVDVAELEEFVLALLDAVTSADVPDQR